MFDLVGSVLESFVGYDVKHTSEMGATCVVVWFFVAWEALRVLLGSTLQKSRILSSGW